MSDVQRGQGHPGTKPLTSTPRCPQYQTECVSGCVCPEGLVDDGRGGCVVEQECPCVHNKDLYAPGDQVEVDCNTWLVAWPGRPWPPVLRGRAGAPPHSAGRALA